MHLSPEQWRRYVGKMQRRPGSGINEQAGTKITAFLVYKESNDLSAVAAPALASPPADGGP